MNKNDGYSVSGAAFNMETIISEEEETDDDEEIERKREEELDELLEHGFDDLNELPDYSYTENSNFIGSGVHGQERDHSVNANPCQEAEDQQVVYMYSNASPLGSQHTNVWSEASDNSENFRQDSIMSRSPSRFKLNMDGVVSQSENSEPLTEHDEAPHELHPEGKPEVNTRQNFISNQNCYSVTDYLSAETNGDQLKLLYDRRGQEIDAISCELANLKLFSSERISSLEREVAIMKEENQTLQASKLEIKNLLETTEERARDLSKELEESEDHRRDLESENKTLNMKILIAEGSIKNLERHVAELQSIDSLARNRLAHEEFLRKLTHSHEEQVEELKRKLKMAKGKVDEYDREMKLIQEKVSALRTENEFTLKEKAKVIQQLRSEVDTANQQIQVLLESNRKYRMSTDDELMNPGLKEKLNLVERQLEQKEEEINKFHMLVKFGFFQAVNCTDISMDQLNLQKRLNFDESPATPTAKAEASSSGNIDDKLKRELLRALFLNKKYTEEIDHLKGTLSKTQKMLENQSDLTKGAESISSIEEFLRELMLKTVHNSPNYLILQKLLESFLQGREHFTDAAKLDQDGTKLQDLERIKSENLELREKIIFLETIIKIKEKEKLQTLSTCKDQIENALLEHKKTLQNEYNSIKLSYEEEIRTLTEKLREMEHNLAGLITEKNKLEESYNLIVHNVNNALMQENLKENEGLKEKLRMLDVKYCEIERKYEEMCVKDGQQSAGSICIADNVELLECKKKVKELVEMIKELEENEKRIKLEYEEKINEMKCELRKMKSELIEGNEKCDISFSQFHETSEKMKQLNNHLREENDKLKIYYEEQIKERNKKFEELKTYYVRQVEELNKKIESCAEDNNIQLANELKVSQEISNALKRKNEELFGLVNKLQEETLKQRTVIQEKETGFAHLTQEKEILYIKFNKELTKHQKNSDQLLHKLRQKKENLRKLQKKYRDFWDEVNKKRQQDWQKREDIIASYQKWITDMQTNLDEEISRILKDFRGIPERLVPNSALEPHINSLEKLREYVLKD